jgi:TPR repeat protein
MRRRLVLVTLLIFPFITRISVASSPAQTTEEMLPPVIESPPPAPELVPHPIPMDDNRLSDRLPHDRENAVTVLQDLRRAALESPNVADNRLKLAQWLYRIGDLDAALEECRVALKLEPTNAGIHLQLGTILMAKQDAHAAAIALTDAIRLDPESAHAHYNLANAQYSLGQLAAAIRSYRRSVELQPSFSDARYRLALVLKLTNHGQESARYMEEAAAAGIPQAQYFIGNAYRNGQGVGKDLAQAIRWWATAVRFGHQRAADSLSQLRRQALSRDQPERRRKDTVEAFQQYREALWNDHSDTVGNEPHESLGIALLKAGRAPDAVVALFDEAFALSEPAHEELARLYEHGLDPLLAQFDRRVLTCFETTAADGFIPAQKALARIYGKGIGVPQDLTKAKAALKGLAKPDIKFVLDEIMNR